jgi:hypothetical protein
MSLIGLFIPTVTQFLMLLTISAVGAAMAIIGGALSGRHRIPEMNVIFGWAFITVIFTVTGALLGWPLEIAGWITVAAVAISLWVVIKRGIPLLPKGIGRTALLGLPMILVVSAMHPSQWDEFAHWIPAAHYLFVWDSFPNADLPRGAASFPGYPYAMGFPVYLASKLAGSFVENTTAVLNVLMLFLFAHLVARVIAAQRVSSQQLFSNDAPPWWACATGILAVTILNPTFVQKLVLTAYAELASGLTLALGMIIAWQMFEELSGGNRSEAKRQAWLFSLVLLLLISLKQSTIALVLILLLVIAIVGMRDPKVKLRDLFSLLPLMIIPAILIFLLWKHYVGENLVNSEHLIRPFDKWFWGLFYDIVLSMLNVVAHKGGYFVPSFIVSGMAIYALFRWRGSRDRLFLMSGLAFLSYNAFLLVTYLAVFSQFDALRVASYWRYNTHLGLILVVAFILVLGIVYRRYIYGRDWNMRYVLWLPVILAVGLQIGLIHKLRFDARLTKIHIREIMPDILEQLPKNGGLFVIDPKSDGAYGTQMRYQLYMANRKIVGNISAYSNTRAAPIRGRLEDGKVDFIWVHSLTNEVRQAVGLELKEGASYLLKRDGTTWRIAKLWPFKGYLSPTEIKD